MGEVVILMQMADKQDEDAGELVMEGNQVWLGDMRTSVAMLYALLRHAAISAELGTKSVTGGVERYRINETGRTLIGRR